MTDSRDLQINYVDEISCMSIDVEKLAISDVRSRKEERSQIQVRSK